MKPTPELGTIDLENIDTMDWIDLKLLENYIQLTAQGQHARHAGKIEAATFFEDAAGRWRAVLAQNPEFQNQEATQ